MSYDKIMGLRGDAYLVCDNQSVYHNSEATCISKEFDSIPNAASFKNQACDAASELLRRARETGWMVDTETWRVLCPGCAAQAGGGE